MQRPWGGRVLGSFKKQQWCQFVPWLWGHLWSLGPAMSTRLLPIKVFSPPFFVFNVIHGVVFWDCDYMIWLNPHSSTKAVLKRICKFFDFPSVDRWECAPPLESGFCDFLTNRSSVDWVTCCRLGGGQTKRDCWLPLPVSRDACSFLRFLSRYTWFTALWWFQVHSKVNLLCVHIRALFLRFFSHVDYYRVLSRVPYVIQ